MCVLHDAKIKRKKLLVPIFILIWVFFPRTGLSLQIHASRLLFCRRQVFHCKLRNQGCSFTKDWIGAGVSRCVPHPTLPLASEQALKDQKRSQGTIVELRRVDLANWTLRTSPKFSTRVKYQGFSPDQRSGNPNHPSPPSLWSINHSVLPKGRSFTANSAFFTLPCSQPSFPYLHTVHLS